MSKIDVYIGTNRVDFSGAINVMRQVSDIRDLSIGSSNKSYTIQIPLTEQNRALLKQYADVRSRQMVTDAGRIYADGVEIISGKVRILSSENNRARVIIDSNNYLDDISNMSLRGLSWVSGERHTHNSTTVSNSWTAAAGALYRYPLINFGLLYSEDHGSSQSKIYPWDFLPIWNVEAIVTKIFAEAGYALDTNGFFHSTEGQKLYVMSGPTPADAGFINGKEFGAYVNSAADNRDSDTVAIGASTSLSVDQQLVMDAETVDEGNDYSIGTHKYVVPEDGVYRFQAKIKVMSTVNNVGGDWDNVTNALDWEIRKDGTTTIVSYSGSGSSLFGTGSASFTLDTGYQFFEAGDEIDVYVDIAATADNISGVEQSAFLYVNALSTDSYLVADWSWKNLWLGDNSTVGPDTHLPDINCLDFLKALKEAYNLRFWLDKPNRTIYIETSDNFYGDTVVDWTDRMDFKNPPKTETIAQNYHKTEVLRWMADTNDRAVTDYVSSDGVPFKKEITLASEYAQQGKRERANAVFGATVAGTMIQIGAYYDEIARIFGSGDLSAAFRYPTERPTDWVPRLLIWEGMTSLTTGNFKYCTGIEDTTGTNYTQQPKVSCPDFADIYSDHMVKDWKRIDNNRAVTAVVTMSLSEWVKFNTVVGTAANEGFRATYKLNIEGVDMYFLINRITTDGDRLKCVLTQKL